MSSSSNGQTGESHLRQGSRIRQKENENANLVPLKELYTKERDQYVKLAPGLSEKVLFHTNLERQNVQFVVRLFDEKNVAPLKTINTFDVSDKLESRFGQYRKMTGTNYNVAVAQKEKENGSEEKEKEEEYGMEMQEKESVKEEKKEKKKMKIERLEKELLHHHNQKEKENGREEKEKKKGDGI
ncbi:myb-like protein X [Palaemon carinicauda]|uniref:myb-like protein X n=1 Tax=Palaemon carinicauda TaxID=392227 RepID=UPI0035B691F6